MKRPKRLDFTAEEVEALIERIESQQLKPDDFPLLADILRAMVWMEYSLKEKNLSIARLRAVFGIKTESAKKLMKLLQKSGGVASGGDSQLNSTNNLSVSGEFSLYDKQGELEKDTSEETVKNCEPDESTKDNISESGEEKKGHGHRPASDYEEARIIKIAHENLSKGNICPNCKKGKLFNLAPGTVLRITGQPWLNVDIYKPERLRCSLCQDVFTAKLPEEIYRESRVDNTAKVIVSILKYRGGVPFYRQEQIQTIFGNPISDTEIWSMTRDVANHSAPIFAELCRLAANSECIHNDDTTARILDLMKENETLQPERTGIFTSAILGKNGDKQIALFFTGRNHAGENLNDLLNLRHEEALVPIQCCDALSRNIPKDHPTLVAYCNAHTRRQFYEIVHYWPKECLTIVSAFDVIFLNDRIAKSNNLSPENRLKWHQEKSAHVMDGIYKYCQELIESKQVEPNSSLGKAINYLKNYWEGMTLFLRLPGIPISNNEDERLIKRSVLNRKNAYFYKNQVGAKIGDILMSIIETCSLNQVNPYNYLLAIQKNFTRVLEQPSGWLPWNYTEAPHPP